MKEKLDTERIQIVKGRRVFESKRKYFDLKCDKLSKKIYGLERKIVLERKDFERKINIVESEKKSLKKKNVRVEKNRCV